jgi:hypothetical protein
MSPGRLWGNTFLADGNYLWNCLQKTGCMNKITKIFYPIINVQMDKLCKIHNYMYGSFKQQNIRI